MSNEVELPASIAELVRHRLITQVHQPPLKSGKEATVYRCSAHPRTGQSWFALKVYRSFEWRAFRADAVYRIGRTSGQSRIDRAIEARSAFGLRAARVVWSKAEFETLWRLGRAGADVPQPIAHTGDALLMEYLGDDHDAAPALREIDLRGDELEACWQRLLRTLRIALACDRVHGDLSPYNILYWRERPVVIDFPQAVDLVANDQARWLLERDLGNVAGWFSRKGLAIDAAAVMDQLWPIGG